MSELIIKAVDGKNIDPIIETRDCYRTNDVIAVFDNKHPWTALESKIQWVIDGNSSASWHGKTYIVKLPSVSKAKVKALMYEDVVNLLLRARRLWMFDLNVIPIADKNAITTNSEVTITSAGSIINGYFKNKITDDPYTGIN